MHRMGVMVAAFAVIMTMGAQAEATPITTPVTLGGMIADGNLTMNVNETPAVTCAQLGLCEGALFEDFTVNPGQSHRNADHPGNPQQGNSAEAPGRWHRDSHANVHTVPDAGATGWLLGLAVAGLALMRRRVSLQA